MHRRNSRRLRIENLESRKLLAADVGLAVAAETDSQSIDDKPAQESLLQNTKNPVDTNVDGKLAKDDASLVLAALQRQSLQSPSGSDFRTDKSLSLDVNGDGALTPLDALRVLNALNRQKASSAEPEGELTERSPFQNPKNNLDVNADGKVSPIDLLLIGNELNARGERQLTSKDRPDEEGPFHDVNGDGEISSIDQVIVTRSLQNAHEMLFSMIDFDSDNRAESVDESIEAIALSLSAFKDVSETV